MTDEREPEVDSLEGASEPLDTGEDDLTRLWETDDDDAEANALDEASDDLVSDEVRSDRAGFWGG